MRQALLGRNRDVSQPTELKASTKSPANRWRAEGLAEQNTDRATAGTLADHATNAAKWSISNVNMGSSSQREVGSGAQARVARHEEASTPPNSRHLESYPHRTEIEGALGVQIKGHAVVDPAACDRQQAIAFTEDRVARFSSDQPSLLVAAHEAVHLAQHAGTTRDAGLGPEGHAGTVAHLISRGQSVRGLIGSSGDIVPTAVRHYPPAASQKNDVAPSPELLNREQIVDIIRRSRDISEVQAKLGFSMLVSAEALAEYFNKKGVTPADFDQMDEARHDRTPQKVMDEVLVPHDYQENRMVSLAVVGTKQEVAQRKAAGEEQARQIASQFIYAAGSEGAQKGSASKAALANIAVTNPGGIVGTTGRTPTVSSPGTPPPPALPPGPRVAALLPVGQVAELTPETAAAQRRSALDTRIAQAESELNPKRQATVEYQTQRKAEGKSLKGGPIKGIWNVKERVWVLKRARAYPDRLLLEQARIVGVQTPDGKIIATTAIAGTGRIPDFVEMRGSKAVAGDLKSTEEFKKSIAGGLKAPEQIGGEFRSSSKVGGQQEVEDKLMETAKKTNGKIVIEGTDVVTGESHRIVVDPDNYASEVLTYEDIQPN